MRTCVSVARKAIVRTRQRTTVCLPFEFQNTDHQPAAAPITSCL